jgi:hypothetical protein
LKDRIHRIFKIRVAVSIASAIQNKGLHIKRECDLGVLKNGVFHQLICPKVKHKKYLRISKTITCTTLLNSVEIMFSPEPTVR